jgi:excisionase family DNA binding protein
MTDLGAKLTPGQLTFTIQEAATVLGISKSSAYEAAHRGELPVLRLGRRLLVTRTTLETLLGLSEPSSSRRADREKGPRRAHWIRLPDGVNTPTPDLAVRRWSSRV